MRFLLTLVLVLSSTVELSAQSTDVWLARSLVGECGWRCSGTGEGAAILAVYQKRSHSRSILSTARQYSAAIRLHGSHNRPWLFGLVGDRRPEAWPVGRASWRRHRPLWLATRAMVADFLRGEVDDPCPEARHYGHPTRDATPRGHTEVCEAEEWRNKFYGRTPRR